MSLQAVSDLSDAVALESNLGLYLKPISRIKINVQIPKLSQPGQSISSWHVMEKLKATVRPDSFLNLKALKITSTVIKFEGELETKASCERALARLRAASSLKLTGFNEKLQVRAAHAAPSGPTRHDWEAFFRDAKGVNEMKPGERPDTIHLQELPVWWFSDGSKSSVPKSKLLRLAFGTFGKIRCLEVPAKVEPGSENTIGKMSSSHKDLLFELYVQYEEYVEFAIAMDSLRGKKLLYKDSNGKVYSADIKVDFDRTRYLSEACIKKREAEEVKLSSNFSVDKTKEATTTKPHSTSEELLAKYIPPKDAATNSCIKSDKSCPKEEARNVNSDVENQKQAHLEARRLLKELLLKAEATQRHKEEVKKLDVIRQQLKFKSSKNSPEEKKKKIDEKHQTELKSHKKRRSMEKLKKAKHTDGKGEKRTLSDNRKITKKSVEEYDVSHYYEKQSKAKIDRKELYEQANDKKKEDKTTRTLKDRHKDKSLISFEKNKDTPIHHAKLNKGSSNEKKYKDKIPFSSHDRTNKDHDTSNPPKKHKKDILEQKYNIRNKHDDKYRDSKVMEGNLEASQLKVGPKELVRKITDTEMYLEEQKIKERLIQKFYQSKKNKEKLIEQEHILKEKLLKNLKAREKEKSKEREKLRRELSGRNVLKSVLAHTNHSPFKKR